VCLLAALLLTSGCAGGYHLGPAARAYSSTVPSVSWITPIDRRDASVLARWRAAVGPPIVRSADPAAGSSAPEGLTIISWNTALGSGDVASLVHELRRQHPRYAVIVLLQEAFRADRELPSHTRGVDFARRLLCGSADREVGALARSLGMSIYYVPSMRNGTPGEAHEDRGNAILSSLPMTALTAIELPFERQRRVAVAATISGMTGSGGEWTLRVVSAHLDNRPGIRKGWIGGEYARTRQARGLIEALRGNEPLVLAGDFNTWFGFADAAFRETAQAFPQTVVTDRRRTFRGVMRLDHVFYRLPVSWRTTVRRGESALGSDHHPLITEIAF
jgi:endonuclease/exonuclease/phosphatase family metal-dependent hydrolase